MTVHDTLTDRAPLPYDFMLAVAVVRAAQR